MNVGERGTITVMAADRSQAAGGAMVRLHRDDKAGVYGLDVCTNCRTYATREIPRKA